MKIIGIKKMSNNKYKVKLDKEEFITFDNVILDNNLLYKKELKLQDLDELKKETNYYNIYNKVLKFCTTRIRCKSEIVKYIDKHNIGEKEKQKILSKLERLGFINDRKYCTAFINDKIHLSKYGLKKIELLLKEKNIDNYIIKEELDRVDFKELNLNLESKIYKEINKNRKYSNYEIKNRILNKFLKEGYDKEKIIELIEKYELNDQDILKKELNKIYDKYEKKYGRHIFQIKVKQKLIQKGFDIDEINELIRKKQKND